MPGAFYPDDDLDPRSYELDYRCPDGRADGQCPLCDSERTIDRHLTDAIRVRLDRAISAIDARADDPADFTGPDADVPAIIAARSDHHAISDAQHAARYLDDDGPFYD